MLVQCIHQGPVSQRYLIKLRISSSLGNRAQFARNIVLLLTYFHFQDFVISEVIPMKPALTHVLCLITLLDMAEPELLLDSNIRLWVVLPIVFITFLVGVIRHYVSILLQSDKKLTLEQVSDR